MTSPFFNAHHSPVGAFATFTFGMKGGRGGLGLELAGPANEDLYVGVEDIESPGSFRALPFFEDLRTKSEDFDVEHLSDFTAVSRITPFSHEEIERSMGPSVDEWRARDLTFRVISPVRSIPEPGVATPNELRDAIAPVILAELTIDNRSGKSPRRAFFGYRGSDRSAGMRVLKGAQFVGIGQHTMTAIATDDPDVYAGISFQPEKVLEPESSENLNFLVGDLGLLVGGVKPGEVRTFRFALGFFREGTATTGISTRYLYRRFFDDIESVLKHGLAQFDATVQEANAFDLRLTEQLSPERRWMASHAIRSYLGSTQLFERQDGSPLWVVNEGEYRMMNTFDLTVDQAFFELSQNPWTLRNQLDLYVERYSYDDLVRLPGSMDTYPGGIAFTHDMGVANAFSRPEFSGYEQSGLRGCFSYMSAEELLNWVLSACLYHSITRDLAWVVSHRETFLNCLRSMVNRDHPEPSLRNGIMGADAARCNGGSEITTYDSLDVSLGQARNNLYLAVKGWATYALLQNLFTVLGEPAAATEAADQAAKAVTSIVNAAGEDGLLPAVIGEGVQSRIIPAIEGLVYAHITSVPIDGKLLNVLSNHLQSVLRPGICKFEDGGWKLSSTSRNSWLSKIYLCQFVAENVLGYAQDIEADRAHVGWLLDLDNAYYAWSDQMLAGKAVGSRYYPRGVTCILWTVPKSSKNPLSDLANLRSKQQVKTG